MELLQDVLFYVQLILGIFLALLMAILAYGNAMERNWKGFSMNLVGFAFIALMLAKPIIYALGFQAG